MQIKITTINPDNSASTNPVKSSISTNFSISTIWNISDSSSIIDNCLLGPHTTFFNSSNNTIPANNLKVNIYQRFQSPFPRFCKGGSGPISIIFNLLNKISYLYNDFIEIRLPLGGAFSLTPEAER